LASGWFQSQQQQKGLLYSSGATALRGYNRSRDQHLQQNGQFLTARNGFKNTFGFLVYRLLSTVKLMGTYHEEDFNFGSVC
jgi:hypothetical protein